MRNGTWGSELRFSGLICQNWGRSDGRCHGNATLELENAENSARDSKLGDSVASTQSECERAIAEAEMVLRELFLVEAEPRQANVEPSNAVNEKREPSRRSAVPRALPSAVDRLRLDPGLDFIVSDEGLIEMTEAGARRMVQAHSAGLDVVIGINGREVLRFLAPKRGLLSQPAQEGRYRSNR
jgi:hypothetical protein